MTRQLLSLLFATSLCTAQAAIPRKPATVMVHGSVIVAFFPPFTDSDLKHDPDLNETLFDFQHYAGALKKELPKSGIEFQELYVHSFRVHAGGRTAVFRPVKDGVGYYFTAPRLQPRIVYGVRTDQDVLAIAHDYFAKAASRQQH